MDTLRRKEDDIFFGTCLQLFEEEILCDVTLIVGDQKEKIRAHKFILIARSEVFCAMLSGNYSETSGEIEIPDIEPDIFKILLRYMYTGHFEEIIEENIFFLLYAGEKYQLGSFVDRCGIFLQKILNCQNYCIILNHATLYNKKELLSECQLYAGLWGDYIVDSEYFISLTSESLLAFVNSNYNCADEANVFKACINWAKNQCEKKRKKITRKNIRQSLGAILQSIRFTTMDIETFTAEVSDEDILTDREKVVYFKSIVNQSEAHKKFNFNDTPGCREKLKIFNFYPTKPRGRVHYQKSHQEVISVKFSKDVHLTEVYVFRPELEHQKLKCNIKVTIKKAGCCILHTFHCSTECTSLFTGDMIAVLIKPILRLTANTRYMFIVDFEGENITWKKGNGQYGVFMLGDLKLLAQRVTNPKQRLKKNAGLSGINRLVII